MRRLWQAHPDDPDIGAFFAEAMMDLRPWDQWTLAGQPQPGTEEKLEMSLIDFSTGKSGLLVLV
jgi:hypothetical protein